MLNKIKQLLLYFSIIPIVYLLLDYYNFQSLVSNRYETPWFSNSFIENPYQMLVLNYFTDDKDKKHYWTGNVYERWYLLEINFKNKKFWTIIERHEIKE